MTIINGATPEGAAIIDLRDRLAAVQEREGDWNGGAVVEELTDWFAQFDNLATADTEPTQGDSLALIGMHQVLAVASRTFSGPPVRDRVIREELGISPTRYFQLLNALLDSPDALAASPVTVNRLRRVREAQRIQREEGGQS